VDLLVENAVIVEIKALPEIDSRAVGQLLNYLKAAGGGVGLLLNFGRRPEFQRRIVSNCLRHMTIARTHRASNKRTPATI
jgi:PD-(D/E)XK nuclease superfamily